MNLQTSLPDLPPDRDEFRRRFAALQASTAQSAPAEAVARLLALVADFERLALPVRHALLGTPLAWTDDERRESRWLHRACDDFAVLGYQMSALTTKRLGANDERARAVIAATF